MTALSLIYQERRKIKDCPLHKPLDQLEFTGITHAGFPKVDGIACAWVLFESSIEQWFPLELFDPHNVSPYNKTRMLRRGIMHILSSNHNLRVELDDVVKFVNEYTFE